jgi:hypothetical protein
MDFLDPKRKKAHQVRLFIGYGLMAILLFFSTATVVLLTRGYYVDRATGDIYRNGLIVVDSHPTSGNVFVNGDLSGSTVRKLVLPEGDYLIEIKRDGYRTWQRNISLEGSVIEQLIYPFLFPETLVSETIASYSDKTALITQSPDRRWLVIEQTNRFGGFDVIDLGNKEYRKTTITLPSDTVTPSKGLHSYELVEWSTNNKDVLVKHSWDNGSEYIVLDINNPLASLNVSKLFTQFSSFEVSLWDKKPNQFYLYNPETKRLVRAKSSDKSATVILAGVEAFKPYKDDIVVYVNDEQEVRILNRDDNVLVREILKHKSYLLDYAEFNKKAYLVVGSGAETKSYIFVDPLKEIKRQPELLPAPFRLLIVKTPKYVSFSNNARFIMVQGGTEFAVFDGETNRLARYDLGVDIAVDERAYWMDGHRLTLVSNNKTNVFDYNGLNLQTLGDSDILTKTFFDRDYEAMFNVFTTGKTREIIKTDLLVKSN